MIDDGYNCAHKSSNDEIKLLLLVNGKRTLLSRQILKSHFSMIWAF